MEKIFLCILVCLFTLMVTSYANEQPDDTKLQTKHTVKKPKCLSRHCIAASNRIFEYIDDKVDPCEDFNEFACGGFNKNTIIPDDKSRWDIFSILTKEIEYHGRRLMEEPIDDKNDFESYKKAKTFYKACMDEDKQNELGLEPFREILAKAGVGPLLKVINGTEKILTSGIKALNFMSLDIHQTSLQRLLSIQTQRIILIGFCILIKLIWDYQRSIGTKV